MDASDKQRFRSIITEAVRLSLLPISQAPLLELCEHADQAMFSNIVKNHNHVLHNLRPPLKVTGHDLRKPTRDRTLLPKEDNSLFRKNFIHRLSTNNYFYSKQYITIYKQYYKFIMHVYHLYFLNFFACHVYIICSMFSL